MYMMVKPLSCFEGKTFVNLGTIHILNVDLKSRDLLRSRGEDFSNIRTSRRKAADNYSEEILPSSSASKNASNQSNEQSNRASVIKKTLSSATDYEQSIKLPRESVRLKPPAPVFKPAENIKHNTTEVKQKAKGAKFTYQYEVNMK